MMSLLITVGDIRDPQAAKNIKAVVVVGKCDAAESKLACDATSRKQKMIV